MGGMFRLDSGRLEAAKKRAGNAMPVRPRRGSASKGLTFWVQVLWRC